MNELSSTQRLPGDRIQCREADGQLELHLPARPLRMASGFGALFCLFTGLSLVVVYLSEGWLLAAVGFGFVDVIILSIAFASMADAYLTTTFVLITPERVTVRTVLYGKERIQEYALGKLRRARQWYGPPRPGRYAKPQGIEIGSELSNPEAGSDLRDETKARFGASLSPGELDWIEWRINQFLDQATDAPLQELSDKPVPRPHDSKVRIEDDYYETRIYIPNGIETRSLAGIGQVIFGLGWSAYFLHLVLHSQNQRPAQSVAFVMYGLFALLGLMFLLSGLTRLLGTRRLTINSERITYRVSLFGIGPSQTLSTAAVLSCGLREIAGNRKLAIAPAKPCVIRTADSELYFGELLRSAKERQWLAEEVTQRIVAARSTN